MSKNSSDFAAADNCVTCGLCLPHCPTYQLHRRETESPRGRVLMIKAARQSPSAAFLPFIDSCLGCRACETACPNTVPVAALATAYRAAHRRHSSRNRWAPKLLRYAAINPFFRRTLQWFLFIAPLGAKIIPAWRELPRRQKFFIAQDYPPHNADHEIALFTGCLAPVLDGDTLRAAVKLLRAAGYSVRAPGGQTCCGALFADAGDIDAARRCGEQNRAVFGNARQVAHCTSGCRQGLSDGGIDSRDICQIIAEATATPVFNPVRRRVFLHWPCSLVNGDPAAVSATRALLKKIPQLNLIDLPQNDICCGAAGVYHLAEKTAARRLRENKLNAWRAVLQNEKNPTILSSNFGCARFLSAANLNARIIHPIEFAAEQLCE